MNVLFRIGLTVGLWLATCTSQYTCSAAQLVVEPSIVESRYCLDDTGALSLKLRVSFTYHNYSGSPIVLPLFEQIAQYTLFRDDESLFRNRPEGQERFRVRRIFDETKLNASRPSSGLFQILGGGEERYRIHQVVIFLRPPRRPGTSLLGSDHFLQVELNHWFGSRRAGETLQRTWRNFGLLWIDNIITPPVKLHIQKDPHPQPCPIRID